MGPAFETFLTALFFFFLLVFGVGLLTRPFWPRIVRYFRRWYERDCLLEEECKQEEVQRKAAEVELRNYCHEEPEDDRREVRLGRRDKEDPAS